MPAAFKLTWAGITVADSSAGDRVSAIKLDQQLLVQPAEGLRAATKTPYNRFNAEHELAFTVHRPEAASPVAATQFIFDRAIDLKNVTGQNDATLILDDYTYTLVKAVVRRTSGGQRGVTNGHDYNVVFGNLTKAAT